MGGRSRTAETCRARQAFGWSVLPGSFGHRVLREQLYLAFGPLAEDDPSRAAAIEYVVRRAAQATGSAGWALRGSRLRAVVAPGQHRFDLRSVGRRSRATPALTGAGSCRFLCGMRLAVPRHLAWPRPQVVLDERVRSARQDASLPPATVPRSEPRVSGAKVAMECALRRGRTRKGRLIATIAAIAVGIAGLVLVAVASTVAGDRALQRGVADLEPTERAFSVTMSPDLSPTAQQLADFNQRISGRLRSRGLGPVLQTVEYRSLAAGDGRTIRFAGIDDLQSAARLVDGNWPTRCDADRCEVVAIVPDSAQPRAVAPLPVDSPLDLTIVGTAIATNDLLLEGELRPDEFEQIVLADGVAKASGLPGYSLIRRSYAWQAPVDGEHLRSIDIAPLLAAVRSIGNDLSLPALHVSGPEDDLLSIGSRTRISGNRLVVPIAALLVLFFGVAVLAGLGGRADHQRTSALLRRRGAGRIGDDHVQGDRGGVAGARWRDRRIGRRSLAGHVVRPSCRPGRHERAESVDRWFHRCPSRRGRRARVGADLHDVEHQRRAAGASRAATACQRRGRCLGSGGVVRPDRARDRSRRAR